MTTSRDAVARRERRAPGPRCPPMNSVGTSIVGDGGDSVSSQLRSKLRYQFRPPVNPVRVNSAT